MHIEPGTFRTAAAALAFTALALAPGTAGAASTPVDGQPSVTDTSPFGAYLWHTDDGWHFRTRGAADGTRFVAHLATNGTVHDIATIRDEPDDHVRLDDAAHALDVSFATYSGIDGVDFRLDDAGFLRVRIEADDNPLPIEDIFLGDDGRHPDRNPFALRLNELRIPDDLRTGYTVRHEADRLMLLTHDDEGSHVYTGTLATAGAIEVLNLVRPEKDDSVSLSADGHTLSFTFSTQEGVDGVVVRVTGSEKVQLSLDTDGQPTPVSAIHLNRGDPRRNPFDLRV